MTIHITPEIEVAFEVHLNEEVDWDFLGQKILRRETRPFFDNPRHGFLEFAAGWQASRERTLEGRGVVWKITPPMSRNAWFTDDPDEVAHFRKPGQGHAIEEFRSVATTGEKA